MFPLLLYINTFIHNIFLSDTSSTLASSSNEVNMAGITLWAIVIFLILIIVLYIIFDFIRRRKEARFNANHIKPKLIITQHAASRTKGKEKKNIKKDSV
jgi:preprotein translocase subunit SecG